MSTLIVFSNNASSLLASGISDTDTSITVTASQGALFPAISAGQIAVGTLEDTSGNLEIVHITGRVSDTMVIVRAQEGTTALSFASGSRFELRVTAGILAALLQKTGSDTLSGTTAFSGILNMSSGSIRGGEYAGGAIRGDPGETDNQLLVPSGGGPPTVGASVILTPSNLISNLPSGTSLALTNMIVFWAGASNAIPSGWLLCDGTHGTPDLRDQFIVGGGGALPTTGGDGDTTTSADSAGSFSIGATALTVAQIPKHTHQITTSYDTLDGAGGSFCMTGILGSAKYGSGGTGHVSGDTGGHSDDSGGPNGAMNGDTHTHTASASGTHDHTYTLPPYRAVFAIMKT